MRDKVLEKMVMFENPILKLDYPDPDVIRVEDTYYMISTTMHFMPGAEILRSYDLQNWEHATYVFDKLDGTDAQCLMNGKQIYGKGMWAASLRYHKGQFYVCFVANDTQKTYLYRAKTIEGPWEKSYIEGFYHDASLFFDDDDRIYIIYGNRQVYITELNAELTGPKPGGLHRILVEDSEEASLGYEGSHFYKIDGYYYLFLIHSSEQQWYRTQACFSATSLTDDFIGGEIFRDDAGHRNSGIAQGGIVDTPNGDYYGILFQDRGASGRIPFVIPVTLQDGTVVMGDQGKMPKAWQIESTRPDYVYQSLVTSGFQGKHKGALHPAWQWNHEPLEAGWKLDSTEDRLTLQTTNLADGLTSARNVLTQRMMEPYCTADVMLTFADMKEGDVAGLCAFQGCYGYIGVKKDATGTYLVMAAKPTDSAIEDKEVEYACILLAEDCQQIRLQARANFDEEDYVTFHYQEDDVWKQLGPKHHLEFRLDHFCGCRFGLFDYATQKVGGSTTFQSFMYGKFD